MIYDSRKGILFIIIAAFGFSLMTFFVNLSGDLPTMQKAFFRNAIALVFSSFLLFRSKENLYFEKKHIPDILMRCFFGTSALIANFYAIDRIGLSDSNMLNKLSPFFAIIISIPVLKERPKKVDIFAALIAFLGSILIIKPGFSLTTGPALIGLYSGFGAGTAYVFVRRMTGNGVRPPLIVFCFSLFSSIVTLPFLVLSYTPMTGKQLLCLLLAGLFATFGQFGITTAYKYAPAKEISVFDYTQVLFAVALGVLFLGQRPDIYSIFGYILIIGIAVFRWHVTNKKEVQ